MIITKPYGEILDPHTSKQAIRLLRNIERYGRKSHLTEERQTADSYDRFLRSNVLNHGDFSIIEHEKATIEVVCDRGVSHEWVRHRLGSYTQESTRFVNYGKEIGGVRFIKPHFKTPENEHIWKQEVQLAEQVYLELLNGGETPQIARSVLPNSTKTSLIVTYNLRVWRHFFIMRTCREAHPQMKEITIPLLEAFQRLVPILYEDIIPNVKQSEGMKLLH